MELSSIVSGVGTKCSKAQVQEEEDLYLCYILRKFPKTLISLVDQFEQIPALCHVQVHRFIRKLSGPNITDGNCHCT